MICNYHRLDGGHRDGTGHHKMLVTLIDWLNIFISSLLTITEIHIKTIKCWAWPVTLVTTYKISLIVWLLKGPNCGVFLSCETHWKWKKILISHYETIFKLNQISTLSKISDWSVHSGRYVIIRLGHLWWVLIVHCAGRRDCCESFHNRIRGSISRLRLKAAYWSEKKQYRYKIYFLRQIGASNIGLHCTDDNSKCIFLQEKMYLLNSTKPIIEPMVTGMIFETERRRNVYQSWCSSPISHNALFCNWNVHTCGHFCYKMVHCGIFTDNIMRFLKLICSQSQSCNFSIITLVCVLWEACFRVVCNITHKIQFIFTWNLWPIIILWHMNKQDNIIYIMNMSYSEYRWIDTSILIQ